MTLDDLIREAVSASKQITSGDIPLKLDGKEITDAKFRLHLDGDCVMYCEMILEAEEK